MMKVYLDVCCLNRPFDDQRQPRVRIEAEAIALILAEIDSGRWRQVSSQMAEIEIAAMDDIERRRRVRALLPPRKDRVRLTPAMFERAEALVRRGFRPADALHVAAAEALHADVLLSCDDRLCRLGRRFRKDLTVRVADLLEWSKEVWNAPDIE
jgi:predicted nucleic acid-binding protein